MACFLEEFEDLYSELLSVFREDDVNGLQSLQARFPKPHSLVTSVDKQGNTLLHLAIDQKSEKIFDYLLTMDDAPINTYNFNRVSPFMFAFNIEARDFTLKLIKKGCNIDEIIRRELVWESGYCLLTIPPLHCAVESEWYEVTKALIERGADLNQRNELGQSPLYVACKKRLVDEAFLLLFYGADATYSVAGSSIDAPNLLGFFQDASIQDLYFTFVAQTNTVHIKTIARAMIYDLPNFSKVLQVTKDLKFSSSSQVEYYICGKLEHFQPNYFKMFLEKFGDVIEDAFVKMGASCPCHRQLYVYRNQITGNDVSLFHQYTENLCHVLNGNFVEKLIPNIKRFYTKCKGYRGNMITCLLYKITRDQSDNRNELESVTRLICCLLNQCAITTELTGKEMDLLLEKYGHCDLFKMLLYMPIRYYKVRKNRSNKSILESIAQISIVPRLMYDVHMSINEYLELLSQFPNYHKNRTLSLISLCDYSALPKMKQHRLPDYGFDKKLVERMEKLPNVPSLVEFARNSARDSIIKRYKIQNSSQFYTILGKLPIAEAHRKIIAFETKLYPA